MVVDSVECTDAIQSSFPDKALWVFSCCRYCSLCSLWRHPIQAVAAGLAAAHRFDVCVFALYFGAGLGTLVSLTPRWRQRRLRLEFMDGLGYTTIIEFAEPLARRRGSALDR